MAGLNRKCILISKDKIWLKKKKKILISAALAGPPARVSHPYFCLRLYPRILNAQHFFFLKKILKKFHNKRIAIITKENSSKREGYNQIIYIYKLCDVKLFLQYIVKTCDCHSIFHKFTNLYSSTTTIPVTRLDSISFIDQQTAD